MFTFVRTFLGVKTDQAVQAGVEALVRWDPRQQPKPSSVPWSATWTNSGCRWRRPVLHTTASGKRP